MPKIEHLRARQVLDSRGSPTIEVEVFLQDGSYGRALVPSGASTGKAEALELRDHDTKDYLGRGVRRAIANVEQAIAPEIMGMEAFDQAALDRMPSWEFHWASREPPPLPRDCRSIAIWEAWELWSYPCPW